jgi:hypothetical protein
MLVCALAVAVLVAVVLVRVALLGARDGAAGLLRHLIDELLAIHVVGSADTPGVNSNRTVCQYFNIHFIRVHLVPFVCSKCIYFSQTVPSIVLVDCRVCIVCTHACRPCGLSGCFQKADAREYRESYLHSKPSGQRREECLPALELAQGATD